jgi:uncharacterized protein (DUF697 family)
MPSLGSRAQKGLGAIGTVRNFASILREISFDEIRDEALITPRFLVLAPNDANGAEVARVLTGADIRPGIMVRGLGERIHEPESYDAVVIFDPDGTGVARRWTERVRGIGNAPAVVEFPARSALTDEAVSQLREKVLKADLERAPAIARIYPAFRETAVRLIIDETAMANAQFALVSNVPSVIPVIGSLAAAGADFLVLTKNQVMLVFKIAAIHGRDLDNHLAIVREMAAVIGAGLAWRTVAREAASLLPFMAGTVPKVVIAYTGTVAAGRGMDFFYRFGKKPSREQMTAYYQQAVEKARKISTLRPSTNGRSPDDELHVDVPEMSEER